MSAFYHIEGSASIMSVTRSHQWDELTSGVDKVGFDAFSVQIRMKQEGFERVNWLCAMKLVNTHLD